MGHPKAFFGINVRATRHLYDWMLTTILFFNPATNFGRLSVDFHLNKAPRTLS